MHQRIPVSTRFAAEGFGGSRFTPVRGVGAAVVPVAAPVLAPDVIVRPPTFIVPPLRPEPILVTEAPASDDTKTLITVAAAIGIFALGAILF